MAEPPSSKEAPLLETEASTPIHSAKGRSILGFTISAVSILAVVWWARSQEAPSFPLSVAQLTSLVLAVAVYAGVTFARGFRWHNILRRSTIVHKPADAYGLTVVGYMGNTVLPARGGEVLRILLMADRSNGRRREILGSIIAERLLDAVTLAVLFTTLAWSGSFDERLGRVPAAVTTIGLALMFGVTSFYLLLRRRGRLERFAALVRPVARASRLLLSRAGAGLALLTVGIWLVESVVLWLVGDSLDLGLTLPETLSLVVLTSLAMSLPAAPGYIGTFDAAVLFGLGRFGIHGGDALACALLWRFVLFAPVTAVGLALVVARYGGLPLLRPRTDGP